jgi:U3 small nucleolar RNA-associated protein MPP10
MPERIALVDPEMEDAVKELLDSNTNPEDTPHSGSEDSDCTPDGSSDAEDASLKQPLDQKDFDAMLAGAVTESESDISGVTSSGDEEHEGGCIEGGTREGEKLPCEDAFLRLADMEAFVQQAEAAEERGDRGGLSNVGAIAEVEADADGELGTFAGSAWALVGQRQHVGSDPDDLEDTDGGLKDGGRVQGGDDVDLFVALGDSEGTMSGSDDEPGIMHDDFFGPQRTLPASRNYKGLTKHGEDRADGLLDRPSCEDNGSSGLEDDNEERVRSLPRAVAAQNDSRQGASSAELSSHEKRVLQIREQIAAMEEAALQEQEWHMRGEASAASRPVDSALAMDLDFEATLRPPPQPTIEVAQALEELIKGRIRDMRFDNVVRVRAASPRKERAALELNDSRSNAGLADVYAEELMANKSSVGADKQAGIRTVCTRALHHMTCSPICTFLPAVLVGQVFSV